MKLISKTRFIEKDYMYNKILNSSEYITEKIAQQIIDEMDCYWHDYTFRFYDDGAVTIYDNNRDEYVLPCDLSGVSYDFYVKERIRLIKQRLNERLIAV
jgi:hypothetical protein